MNDSILYNQIRQILLQDWDPFCIGSNPHLADEYDEFIEELVQKLWEGNDTAIHQYLIEVENELEAPIQASQRTKAVNALRALVS